MQLFSLSFVQFQFHVLSQQYFFQQWIALVTTPQGWKMPVKSKITFENTEPPEVRFEYSFCEVRERRHVTMID